jgi:hypothetical protein
MNCHRSESFPTQSKCQSRLSIREAFMALGLMPVYRPLADAMPQIRTKTILQVFGERLDRPASRFSVAQIRSSDAREPCPAPDHGGRRITQRAREGVGDGRIWEVFAPF